MRRHDQFLSLLCLVSTAFTQVTFSSSAKRSLSFVPLPQSPQDNEMWVKPGSDLTWYYTCMWSPSPTFSTIPQSQFEYDPMIWEAPANHNDWDFLQNVPDRIEERRKISHVLEFSEPNGLGSQGGSNMSVSGIVDSWTTEIEPSKKLSVKLGAPAVTQRGRDWLAQFMAVFEVLIKTIHTICPAPRLWITEFGNGHGVVQPTQDFFNEKTQFPGDANYIERYLCFGAFRSNAGKIDSNGYMLTQDGKLIDIRSWYLGGAAADNVSSVASKIYGVGTDVWVVIE
ncbi:glycoside hydrolase family 128 protein [Stipitochalara longipes BDJ]|nr:glycoside hydrolase family 128 protein [Stipitochalara longipes BDJ]